MNFPAIECDVLVIGAGAGGLSAALTAAASGLSVIVAEKTPFIGGTAALSGGVLWMPGNPVSPRSGVIDSTEATTAYLRQLTGNRFDEPRISTFLEYGPKMISAFEELGAVELVNPSQPDYRQAMTGASPGGRSLASLPLDGRRLGDQVGLLRRPLPQMTLFGGMMLGGADLQHFLKMARVLSSTVYVGKLLMRYGVDRLLHGRSMRLTGGSALVARLMAATTRLGANFWLSSPIDRLMVESGRVTGALISRDGILTAVRAKRGVILATGGIPAEEELLNRNVRRQVDGVKLSLTLPTNTGDGARLGIVAGAVKRQDPINPAVYTPVSTLRSRNGAATVFPHFVERTKPGFIAVNQQGKRFVNEANSYVEFGEAMVTRALHGDRPLAYLICDHTALRRYGMGPVRPAPMPFIARQWRGYLFTAPTIADLARQLEIDSATLQATVARVNADAAAGQDSEFGKGENALNHFLGDKSRTSPNFGSIVAGPYHAVRLELGDYGTMMGLDTDAHARVVDAAGEPIPGLYAVGSDMAPIFGGAYPGGGTSLGPALTFGYVAALHIAGRIAAKT